MVLVIPVQETSMILLQNVPSHVSVRSTFHKINIIPGCSVIEPNAGWALLYTIDR